MAFRFKQANCVTIGTFNIYIVQPNWLSQVGILPSKDGHQLLFETDMVRPGFRFSSPDLGSKWNVRPDRLELETDNPNEDCGQTVASVLSTLQWTPVVAVGTNTIYSSPKDDKGDIPAPFSFGKYESPEGFEINESSCHTAFANGDQIYNVFLINRQTELEIQVNVHTALKGQGTLEMSKHGQETARAFMEHRRKGEALVRDVFNLELIYDRDND